MRNFHFYLKNKIKIKMKLLLMLLILSYVSLNADDLNMLFKQANSFLQQGNYYDAIKIYKGLEDKSNDSNLYYNIGNCYSQINEMGQAVLYYKRALWIDSSNSPARNALNDIEETIISASIAENSFTNRLLLNIYNWLSLNRLLNLVLFLFLTLGLFIFVFLSHSISISVFAKRFYLTLNIFLLAFFIVLSISKFISYKTNQEAVILKNNTLISKDEDGRIFVTNKKLQAGLTVKFIASIEDRKAGYSQLALPNGELVVLDNQSFERVREKK